MKPAVNPTSACNRIDARFAALRAARKPAFIPFIMAGDPSVESSLELLKTLPDAGADLIELGTPFSDPMADGIAIQEAGKRALKAGVTLAKILEMVAAFRKTNAETPIILMGYYNPVYHYGVEKFCRDASAAGVDGVIIVDLPPEEESEFVPSADKQGIYLIRLIAPTTDDTRLPLLLKSARGFVYTIAIKGITGAASATPQELAQNVARIRKHSDLPVAIGFGVKTPEQVKAMGEVADAVVVGSAIVQQMGEQKSDKMDIKQVTRFVSRLSGNI